MLVFRKPRAWLLLVFSIAEIVFVAAAHWQWQRGEFKDRRAREFAAALASPEAPERSPHAIDSLDQDFAAARLRGRLLTERLVLHDNRIVDGQYGVDVYVPLQLVDGFVLVNLGWIQADRSRRVAPSIPPIAAAFDARGLLAPPPAPGLLAADASVPALSDPSRLRLHVDPAQIAREAPQLQPMAGRVFWPAADAASPFKRDWRPPGMSGERHRGYALQWASFAIASLVLFLIFHLRRKEVRQ